MDALESPDRVVRDESRGAVSRRRFVERAATLGAAMPALGALVLAAAPRTAGAEEDEAPRMFTREFRLPTVPSFEGGTVLYLARRFIASDQPIPENMRVGATLYYVASVAEDGYLDLTHTEASTGTTTVHSHNGDNHDIPAGTTIKLYAGDAALVVDATYRIECDAFEGGTLLMAGLDQGGGCAGRPCP
ncbi:MAG TPA: hypothetical protein VH482_17930 [Thermomicrobiales bacterium]